MTLYIKLFLLTIFFRVPLTICDDKSLVNNDSESTYIIYRIPQLGGAGTNWVVYDNGKKLCRLSNKKYLIYNRPAGHAVFKIKTGGFLYSNKTRDLETSCGPGETCYLKADIETNKSKTNLWPFLKEASHQEATFDLREMSLDNCNNRLD